MERLFRQCCQPLVTFINILGMNFSHQRHFGRFSSYILALAKNSYEKRVRIMLMKLTTGQQTQKVKFFGEKIVGLGMYKISGKIVKTLL